jgi:hypothetical protein
MTERTQEGANMETETKNFVAERFLGRVGYAVIIGFLAAVLWGLTGLPAPDFAQRDDLAGVKILED